MLNLGLGAGTSTELDPFASAQVMWPQFADLVFSDAELTNRRKVIGGSDANVILSGDAERILRLWREKRGEAEPEDLSSVLAVMLGCWTEAFNRQWFERSPGNEVGRVGETHRVPQEPVAPLHASMAWSRARSHLGSQAHQRLCKAPTRCSSATCPSSSTTWRWPATSGRCSR